MLEQGLNLVFVWFIVNYVHTCVASEMQGKKQQNMHLKVVNNAVLGPIYVILTSLN